MAFLQGVHKYLLFFLCKKSQRKTYCLGLFRLTAEIVTLSARYFGVGSPRLSSARQRTGADEKRSRLGFCPAEPSALGHPWSKAMSALKWSVINFWRGLYDTVFCDSKRLNSPTQKAPFWSSVAKMLLPRQELLTAGRHSLGESALQHPVQQVMLPGDTAPFRGTTSISWSPQSSLLLWRPQSFGASG